jgi:hypothetical protein
MVNRAGKDANLHGLKLQRIIKYLILAPNAQVRP